MLARRSTTKISARDQNTCARVARLIQHELGILLPVRAKPPVVKQKLAEPRALNPLQKLLGNNLIGIHINPIQRRHTPPMHGEWFHCVILKVCSSNTLSFRAESRNLLLACVRSKSAASTTDESTDESMMVSTEISNSECR